MRILITAFLLAFSFAAFSQGSYPTDTTQMYKSRDYGWIHKRLLARVQLLPADTVANKNGLAAIGTSLYLGNGTRWFGISGGGGGSTDTTSLSNRINLKLNIADTAAMLTPYVAFGDTAYLQFTGTTNTSKKMTGDIDFVNGIAIKSTTPISGREAKFGFEDAAPYMLSNSLTGAYGLFRYNLPDNTFRIENGTASSKGLIGNMNYSANLTGSDGNAFIQKNYVDLRLKISDTATMLTPYARSAAVTASLSSKLNIADTANKWVGNIQVLNDSTIRVYEGSSFTDLQILGKANSGGVSPNFFNSDETATDNRSHWFNYKNLNISGINNLDLTSRDASGLNSIGYRTEFDDRNVTMFVNTPSTNHYINLNTNGVQLIAGNGNNNLFLEGNTLEIINSGGIKLNDSIGTFGQVLTSQGPGLHARWKTITGSGSDPLKLNISDTASMLSPYSTLAEVRKEIEDSTQFFIVGEGLSLSGDTIKLKEVSPGEIGGVTQAMADVWNNAEPDLGLPSTNGYVLSSTTAGVRSWVAQSGGGGGTWGSITGTLSAQTDLQNALNLKANLASPTFTGTVTLPAGQVVNGVTLTTGGGTTNFLRADGTYAAPAGGGSGIDDNPEIKLLQGLGSLIKAQNFNASEATTTAGLVDGTARFFAVYLSKGQTITGVQYYQTGQGVYTADNNNQVALYTVNAATGVLTRVAESVNDGNIWKQVNTTTYKVPFSSTYVASAGVYYIGLLYNSSAQSTAPTILARSAAQNAAAMSLDNTGSLTKSMTLNSQTALGTTYTASGLTTSATNPWVSIY